MVPASLGPSASSSGIEQGHAPHARRWAHWGGSSPRPTRTGRSRCCWRCSAS